MGNVVPLKRTAAVQHPQERIAQWRADPVAFVEFNWPGCTSSRSSERH